LCEQSLAPAKHKQSFSFCQYFETSSTIPMQVHYSKPIFTPPLQHLPYPKFVTQAILLLLLKMHKN
jgi:hypothetical protein